MAGEKVALYNLHDEEYVEEWQDKEYRIPPGGFITMSRRDAIRFKGNYSGMDRKTGVPRVKMLEIRPLNGEAMPEQEEFVSDRTGERFATQVELDAHLKKYAGEVIRDEAAEERIKGIDPHNLIVKCPMCNREVRGKAGLRTHLNTCKG